MQKVLTRLFNLKQNDRFYAKYFEKTRNIERDLLKELFLIISNRLMQKLNNNILKMLMRALLNQITIMQKNESKSNLKMIIRLIKNDLEDMNKKNQKFMIEIDKYRDLKSANKAVTEILKRSFKMMNEALKQNVKVIERMLNKMMFFNKFNFRSNYEQNENNNSQKNRQIQNQNNRINQRIRHNDENIQVSVSLKI